MSSNYDGGCFFEEGSNLSDLELNLDCEDQHLRIVNNGENMSEVIYYSLFEGAQVTEDIPIQLSSGQFIEVNFEESDYKRIELAIPYKNGEIKIKAVENNCNGEEPLLNLDYNLGPRCFLLHHFKQF